MKTILTLAVAGLALVGLGSVNANPRDYVNITGDQLIDCHPELPFDQGGSCFAAGHISGDSNGVASVSLNDGLLNPVSGFWCQDLDNDGSCDDATEDIFCAFWVFQDVAFGGDWDPGAPLFIFLDGPVFGNPVISACGLGSVSIGSVGNVDHS